MIFLAGMRELPVSGAVRNDVRMAPATPGAVRFTVFVPAPRFAPSLAEGGVTHLQLDGYAIDGAPASPALPIRVVAVAVPPLGEVRVNAVGSATETHDLLLAPAPSRAARDAGTSVAPDEGRSPRAYAAAGTLSAPRARLLDVSWMRNQRVARIAIEPAGYDPRTRTLALDRRVDVELAVEPSGSLGPPAEDPDPFEGAYARALVNYEQGRGWRRPATDALVAAVRRRGAESLRGLGVGVPDTSLFAGRGWAKLAIAQPGFYRVTFSDVRNTAVFNNEQTTPMDSLRLFTLPGSPLLPESDYCDTCEYREVAIGTIDADNDGLYGTNSDGFYFFALGSSDWLDTYAPGAADTSFLNHPYDAKNYYYLTIATGTAPVGGVPRRIATRIGSPGVTGVTPTTFEEREHHEFDLEYFPDASPQGSTLVWEKWFWRALVSGQSATFATTIDVPQADTTLPARLRMRAWGLNRNAFVFGSCIPSIPDHFLDVTFNGVAFPRRVFVGTKGSDRAGQTWDTTGAFLRLTGNVLNLAIPTVTDPSCPIRVDRSGLSWFDLFYSRKFVPTGDRLEFRSPPGAGDFVYDIGPFVRTIAPRVFDVTDPYGPVEITAFSYVPGAGGFQLRFGDVQTERRRFRILPDSLVTQSRFAATDVGDAPLTSYDNLRSPTKRADYLVIYYDGFRAAADSLVRWRRQRLPLVGSVAPYDSALVPVSALYDQFSGGRTDPSAIRNFLRAVYYQWQKRPAFVTFLGDASYDFKNLQGRAPSGQPGTLVPSYENGFDASGGIDRQYATDDWMLNVNDPNVVVPDFFGGRIPAADATNALQVVRDKVLAYERSVPYGEYRNKVMLIADDDQQGESCDGLGWDHLRQTYVLDTLSTPEHLDRVYVYLHTYPDGPGKTKPGARADIKNNLNSGVAMFNYVGHGSPFKISDESVFLDTDSGTLANAGRLPLFVAASCDVGKFNDPTVPSLGERLVLTPGAGTIAVISATELAFSFQNADLNNRLYDGIFERDTLNAGARILLGEGQYHAPLAAALLAAKVNAPSVNNQKYQLMGDAATQLNLPRLWTELSLEDAAGTPITQLPRGQTVTFRGQVLDRPGGTPVGVDGIASLLIEDSQPVDLTYANQDCIASRYQQEYRFRAGSMYRGDVSVAGGVFSGSFVVPLDAIAGVRGRVRAYMQGRPTASQALTDGAGSELTEIVPGSAPIGDDEGPRITLSFVGGATSVRPDATLRIDLFDPSGIMITGHSLLNSIVVTVDDNTTSRVDVTSSFRYAADSYQSGTASFQLPNLSAGPHRVRVSAADNLAAGITASQHRSSATLDFEVVDVPPLNVARAYLFPTPARSGGPGSGGQFVVDAPGDSVNTMIRVYTVSGRLVRTLHLMGALGQIQVPWDGLDAEGDRLANGTYLFKVYVSVREPDGSSSARQRAIAEGRFVIVN